jgi:hypothetical protein
MEAIGEEMSRRRSAQTPLIEAMMGVRDRYNADVVVPVPDTDDDIPYDSMAPLLIADAVDHPAMYAAQAAPTFFVPALDPGKHTGVRSTDFASRRRKALHYCWDISWWEMVLGRMYRHLAAYGTSALVVELDVASKCPRITTRDPLSAYPEPKAPEDLTPPRNVGFIFGKSLDWMHANYPDTRDRFPRGSGFAVGTSAEGEIWDMVEWMDDEEVVLGVLGPRDVYHSWTKEPIKWAFELDRYPNVLGRCPAVMPRRVTLDRIMSQLANLTGHVDLMARLLYLDIRATERSIFPDRYVLSRTGQNPRLAHGKWLDGETGEINMILDADAVGNLPSSPDPNNKTTMATLERNFRVSSGLIPQAGGETYGALRTGRGIDALMGAALDPRTTELHRVAGRYMTEVNELVLLAFAKMWPNRKFSVYSPLDPGATEFVPQEHVERDPDGELFIDNRVFYPIPGMDDINATQVIGQMQGTGLIASYDARRMHPHIVDPEGTERRLLVEQMESMMLQALGTRATTPPGIPPNDLARMIELVYEGKRVHEAVQIADGEASRRQAAIDVESAEMGGQPGPEQMPGLANPGEGAEMGGGLVSSKGTDLERLREMVGAMRSTSAPPPAQGGR